MTKAELAGWAMVGYMDYCKFRPFYPPFFEDEDEYLKGWNKSQADFAHLLNSSMWPW